MIKLNGNQVIPTIFPDQTSQIWKLPEEAFQNSFVRIEWEFSHEGEFLQLAQLRDLLEKRNIISELHLTYLPYGRQDKEISNNTTFALETFSKLLNTLNFARVWCLDPHSKVPENLINNFIPCYPLRDLESVLIETANKRDVICYPDKGAFEKYTGAYGFKNVIHGSKVRNQETGKLEKYEIIGDCKDKNVLIIDDICDGGATFCGLAELLRYNGAKEINLFVTHGIFSKGLKVLHKSGINRVFTHKGEAFEEQGVIVYKEFQ